MPLPFGKNQIDKLGERLAAATEPTDEDLAKLEELIIAHAEVVTQVRGMLTSLEDELAGVSITGRAKTTQTIIDKVGRNHTRLSSMEDLAGVRVVAPMLLDAQEYVVSTVVTLFTSGESVPKVIDRRSDPRSGYRAVHVIAKVDGLTVEIQIRTHWQDAWANMFERAADEYGRAIRYGGPPTPKPGQSQEEADQDVADMLAWAEQLHELEQRTASGAENQLDLVTQLAGVFLWTVARNRN
jgi:ppGpp synthetase/RelA/SpoT-type nucleotidyltranferase